MRNLFKYAVFLFVQIFFVTNASSQRDTAYFMQNYKQGNILHNATKIDSSMFYYEKAYTWSKQNPFFDTSKAVTELMSVMGRCYRLQNKVELAHGILTNALNNARKYNHINSKLAIIKRFTALHDYIAEKNLPFVYPTIDETETTQVYFSIKSVQSLSSDSLEIVVGAGKLDGIVHTTEVGGIYTRIISKDSTHHNSVKYISEAIVYKLADNYTILHVKKDSNFIILPKDFFVCNTQVPVSWNNLQLKNFLQKNIIFTDATNNMYGYRHFYYFGDTTLENEVMQAMLRDAKSAALLVAKDTLTNSDLAYKFSGGVFSGKSLWKSILISEPIHQQLYFDYIINVPAYVMGNNKHFTIEYASWIGTSSTLYPPSIKPYLLGITNKKERQTQAFNLYKQIKEKSLIEEWLGEGMQQVNDENIEAAKLTANLIDEVTSITKDSANFGWAEYLWASIEKKNENINEANKYLLIAQNKFEIYNNTEGKAWAKASKEKWLKPNTIGISTQAGHITNYIVAQSPNPKYFATGGADDLIKIWDKMLGKEIATLNKHKNIITSLHYSPNGKYLVSASLDKTVTVWNAYNYTELITYTTDAPCYVAKFSPNSKLLFAAEDSTLFIINPFSDTFSLVKKIVLHHDNINDFEFAVNNANIIYSSSDNEMRHWNIRDSILLYTYTKFTQIKNIQVSKDGKFLCTVSKDSTIRVIDLFTAKTVSTQKIFLEATGKKNSFPAMYATQSFSPDSKYLVYPVTKDSFKIVNLLDFYSRKYRMKLDTKSIIRHSLFSKDGDDLMITNNGYDITLLNMREYDFKKNYQLKDKSIKFYSNSIFTVQYKKDDKELYFFQYGPDLGRIDLSNGRSSSERLSDMDITLETNHVFLQEDSLAVIKLKSINNQVFLISTKGSIDATIQLPENETVTSFETTANNTTCFASSTNGVIVGWDIASNKQIFSNKIKTDTTSTTMILYYDNFNNRLFTKINDNNVVIINPENGIVTDTIVVRGARQIINTKTKIYISTGYGKLTIFDAKNFQELTTWNVNYTNQAAAKMVLSPNNKYLIIQNTPNSITAFDTQIDSFLYTIPDHPYTSWSIAMSHSGKEFATAGGEGTIFIYETETGKKKATINMPFGREPFIVDDENHYLAPKNTLEAINIAYNDNVYSYDQFDVQLNRPDIVLKKLGRGDTSLIKSYANAYKKRIKKLGINENSTATNGHLPSIKIKNKFAIQTSTKAKEYVLNIECIDTEYPLQSLQVLVNNSPVLGVSGRDLSKLKTKQTIQQATIPLAKGNNAIKIYCTNSKGATSLKESFTVLSTFSNDSLTTLYFAGIGVAKYKDSSMNLTYSAKDIRDLAADFTRLYGKAFKVIIDTLLNENVTKENILKLKKRLQQTNPNDRVVIAITGHGLLSDSLNFYYATYDINFAKPELRGLQYDEIEGLLNDVPAQEKIMFIDACHSGALDKDEILAIKNSKNNIVINKSDQKNVKGIASRSSINIKNKTAKVSANSSFELMQNLFSDLSNGNGAVIISAAGGMEYAFESAKWNNGVFTYCIREGIFDGYADKYYGGNDDRKISVQELSNYVNKRVSELTNGKQKPTSRKENMDFNWTIKFY